jgi:hypothetical protein
MRDTPVNRAGMSARRKTVNLATVPQRNPTRDSGGSCRTEVELPDCVARVRGYGRSVQLQQLAKLFG